MDYGGPTLNSIIFNRYTNIDEIINHSKQIVDGVRILHQSGIVHRDLKPDNFLVETIPF